MHGVHIANDLLEKANAQGKVTALHIELGQIANITKEDLQKQLMNQTQAQIDIKILPAVVQCMCTYTGEPKVVERQHEVVLFECPVCGQQPQVIQGDQIVLKSVDVE